MSMKYESPKCHATYTSDVLLKSRVTGSCLVLSTYETKHGRSSHLYVERAAITAFLCDASQYHYAEFDINNSIRIHKGNNGSVTMELTWLYGTDDMITGYRQTMYTDIDTLLDICEMENYASEHICLLHTDSAMKKSRIILTPDAHKRVKMLNKQERHAFAKCLSRAFYYGEDAVFRIGCDYGKSFWFTEELAGTRGISGGICISETTHTNHRGTYPAVQYSIHT